MVKIHSFDFAGSVVYRHAKPMRHPATSLTDVLLRRLHQSLFAVDFSCAAGAGSQPQLPVASGDLSDWSASPVRNTCQWIQLFQYGYDHKQFPKLTIHPVCEARLSTHCFNMFQSGLITIVGVLKSLRDGEMLRLHPAATVYLKPGQASN